MKEKNTFTLSGLLLLGATHLNAQTAPEAVMSPQELQVAKPSGRIVKQSTCAL